MKATIYGRPGLPPDGAATFQVRTWLLDFGGLRQLVFQDTGDPTRNVASVELSKEEVFALAMRLLQAYEGMR